MECQKSKTKWQGSIAYLTDREDEVCKMFLRDISCVHEDFWKRLLFQWNGYKMTNPLKEERLDSKSRFIC